MKHGSPRKLSNMTGMERRVRLIYAKIRAIIQFGFRKKCEHAPR